METCKSCGSSTEITWIKYENLAKEYLCAICFAWIWKALRRYNNRNYY